MDGRTLGVFPVYFGFPSLPVTNNAVMTFSHPCPDTCVRVSLGYVSSCGIATREVRPWTLMPNYFPKLLFRNILVSVDD